MASPGWKKVDERLTRFIENDWLHLNTKVAAIEAKLWVVMGLCVAIGGGLVAVFLK